jgi:uncharacterized membrane protein (UPF0182 family)
MYLHTKKHTGYILEGLGMENVGIFTFFEIFYGHSGDFTAVRYILFTFGILYFKAISYILSRFGMLYQEKSSNPDANQTSKNTKLSVGYLLTHAAGFQAVSVIKTWLKAILVINFFEILVILSIFRHFGDQFFDILVILSTFFDSRQCGSRHRNVAFDFAVKKTKTNFERG